MPVTPHPSDPDKDALRELLQPPQEQTSILPGLIKAGLVVGGIALIGQALSAQAKERQCFVAGPVDNCPSLGKAILQRREDLRLTQEQLAERSGVGVRFISEVENGKKTAEVGKILQVLDALGIQLTATLRS